MSERTPETVLWDLMRGAMTTRALGVVADLGVAEALADRARPVDELAREVGADADVLHRVLRALASEGVFAEDAPGRVRNTDVSRLLLDPGWGAFAHLFGDVFYDAVADLDRATRTGAPTFAERFGDGFWPWLEAHRDERSIFDRAMATGKSRSAERLAALDWRDGETVVDIGGGNGTLLVELIRRRPGLHGIVFDLPETDRDESALGPDVEFVAGSFFEHVPSGDTYLLSGILHDWDDEPATSILRTIRASASPGARVLAAESVIPSANEPHGGKWLDLLMLLLAGGRERDEEQWRALLVGAGLAPVRIDDGLVEARCP
jgi:hypothetical protein